MSGINHPCENGCSISHFPPQGAPWPSFRHVKIEKSKQSIARKRIPQNLTMLIPDALASGTVRKQVLLLTSHPVCVISSIASQTKTNG